MADRTCSAYKCTLLCDSKLNIVRLTEVLNETCSDYWPGHRFHIGNNQQEVLASLREDAPGSLSLKSLKIQECAATYGATSNWTPPAIDRKVVRFTNDASIYSYLSMQQAIEDAGLKDEVYQQNPRVGLIAGSGGSSKSQVFGADAMRSPRSEAVGPYVVTKAMASAVIRLPLQTPFKITA